MKILAFDTSTDVLSVALRVGDESELRHQQAPRRHAELLLPWCDALLKQAGLSLSDLDGIGFGCGPGAFTGVRIAVSAAQGMALAADLPLAPVSSLASTALAAHEAGLGDRLLVTFDARMQEVYWGCYGAVGGALEVLKADALDAPGDLRLPEGESNEATWTGVGPGFAAYRDDFRPDLLSCMARIDDQALPNAGATARLAEGLLKRGQGVAAERAQPVYLRDRVTQR